MQALFEQEKVGVYLDTITHATEKRRGEDVKIVTLGLRIQPFTPELAASLDAGMQTDAGVRALLFSLTDAEPKKGLRRADFALGVPRQQLLIYATTDTVKESIAFDQVKVTGTYARTQKDVDGFAFIFRASFGPCGRSELEFVQDWHLGQRFLTFRQAEPGLFDEPVEANDDATEADQVAQRAAQPLEWDDDATGTGRPLEDGAPAAGSIGEVEHGARRSLHTGRMGRRAAGRRSLHAVDAPLEDEVDSDEGNTAPAVEG